MKCTDKSEGKTWDERRRESRGCLVAIGTQIQEVEDPFHENLALLSIQNAKSLRFVVVF